MQRLHFTREHMGIYLQRSADRRDHQTDNKSDQREQKRQNVQPGRRFITPAGSPVPALHSRSLDT